jgi:hypothetical protein
VPKVFVSHSHVDKPVARRIVHFLRLYGIDVWLDERELRLGNRLDDSIRQAIMGCETVVVVASAAASKSPWVEREVAFALASTPGIPVCPVYVDAIMAHSTFAPHLGIDGTDRYRFCEVLTRLAEAFVGSPLPEPDRTRLEIAFNELTQQNSALALLIEGCLRGEGLLYEQVTLVAEVPFFDLDGALDLMSMVGGESRAAYATAALFSKTGAGTAALCRYGQRGHDVLNAAVGTELNPTVLEPALRLLQASNPRDDQAFTSFLWKNKKSLAGNYRDRIVYLLTHPLRGPDGFAADAAAAAFDVCPDDEDLVTFWSRWVREGLFEEGKCLNCDAFAYWSGRGLQSGNGGWNKVYDQFVMGVRWLARKKSRASVETAIDHMIANVDRSNPRASEVIEACHDALGAAEWDRWEYREEMSTYVSELTAEARRGGNWVAAKLKASESWKTQAAFRSSAHKRGELT